jgi:hypothetical protein
VLGGSDERGKKRKNKAWASCKIALGSDEEKQNLTALSSAQS